MSLCSNICNKMSSTPKFLEIRNVMHGNEMILSFCPIFLNLCIFIAVKQFEELKCVIWIVFILLSKVTTKRFYDIDM